MVLAVLAAVCLRFVCWRSACGFAYALLAFCLRVLKYVQLLYVSFCRNPLGFLRFLTRFRFACVPRFVRLARLHFAFLGFGQFCCVLLRFGSFYNVFRGFAAGAGGLGAGSYINVYVCTTSIRQSKA